MQTQTLEPTAKWQVVRAEWVLRLLDGKQPDGRPQTREKAEDYASWFTRCQSLKEGFDMPSYAGKPECGYYAVLGINKVRWYTCCYQRDEKGTIVCWLNGELRHPDNMKLADWEELWAKAVKKPLEYPDYKHLKDTGRLPGESEAAAADRGNVVSINAGNGATLVPAAPRSDGSAVTTTHNQPPQEDTWDTLKDRIDRLTIEGDTFLKNGAKTQDEAHRIADLATTCGKVEKTGIALRDAEKAPHKQKKAEADAEMKRITVNWEPVVDVAASYKTKLKAEGDRWTNAEKRRKEAERKRAEEEQKAQLEAGANSNDLAPLPSTDVPPLGSGLDRRLGQHEIWDPEFEDLQKFVINHWNTEAIKEGALKLGKAYAKNKIDPPPEGLKYNKRTQTV